MNQNANSPSWELDGKSYPLFPFDVPQTITLPNGTRHKFKMWTDTIEKKREDLLKTIVVTSPAIINGENPVDAKTDFSRSMLAYYALMIDQISGVQYNGNGPDEWLDAHKTIEVDGRTVELYDLVSTPIRKAAAARLYGGRIAVERPKTEDEEVDFDPFELDPESLAAQVEAQQSRKEIYQLSLQRSIVLRHEIGIEQLPSGLTTEPTHVIRYHFKEPSGDDFSKWELKSFKGYSLSLNKGGNRAERYYNLDTLRQLFDSLIDRIEGASLHGQEIILPEDRNDPQRIALLAMIPLALKKNTVATLFGEVSNLGNV